jgi:hypothetical protein
MPPGPEIGRQTMSSRNQIPLVPASMFHTTRAGVHGFAQRSREMQRLGADKARCMKFLFSANSDFLCIFAQILQLLGICGEERGVLAKAVKVSVLPVTRNPIALRMNQRSLVALMMLGAFSAIATRPASGQTRPATVPAASQPAVVNLDQLIKQLGSDDPADRDAAQRELVARGDVAIDPLKNAADHSDDLEIRSRAAAALAQIAEHNAFDTSLITLHLKDAPEQDALNAIAAQARAQFTGMAAGIPIGPAGRVISINADKKPFWAVMTDFCGQTGLCPTLEAPTKNTLRLFPTPRNWFLDSPHKIIGPYWIGVAGMNRSRTIDLMGPQRVDDQFTMQFIVYPEPKLAVTQISEFNLKEATDDAGNSLLPTGPAAPRAAIAAMPMLAMGRSVMRSRSQTMHIVETRLAYPEHPGKRITTLRGDVVVTLAEGVQQFVVDDLMGTPKQTNPVKHLQVHVGVTHNGPDFFQVSLECTRDGMLDEQWFAIANRVNDITLEDAEGHPLTLSYAATTAYTDTMFKSTALFTRNIYAAQQQLLNRQVTGHTGDAKRLTWNIATRLKSVTVPVTFNDLPMP